MIWLTIAPMVGADDNSANVVDYTAMPSSDPHASIAAIPPGPWAVGVSGGADSVALLALCRARPDLALHVVHLNHELRGQESDEDALFVAQLARQWGLVSTIARRSEIEPAVASPPANPSSLWRELRLALFRRVVAQHQLQGALLGHHADDQAETVLQRLLRGSGPRGLVGMRPRTTLGGLPVLRPLLHVRAADLRAFLRAIAQPWREDSSNASDDYARNRLRVTLREHPRLTDDLLALSRACERWSAWLSAAAPELPAAFELEAVRRLPAALAGESLRRWLIARGAPAGEVDEKAVARLLEMAQDAAAPARQMFSGGVLVRRRQGVIIAQR